MTARTASILKDNLDLLMISQGERAWPLGCVDIVNYARCLGWNALAVRIETAASLWLLQISPPRIIGLSLDTSQAGAAEDIVREIRQLWPGAKLVFGGRHIQRETLDEPLMQLADHLVVGAGEYPILDLLMGESDERCLYGKPFEMADYATLPMPSERQHKDALGGTAHVMFSRGCPFRCFFCEDSRHSVVRKHPSVAVDYIRQVVGWSKSRRVFVYDDVLTADKPWLHSFADRMSTFSDGIELEVFAHAATLTEEKLSWLRQAGVVRVNVGAESGDDHVLATNRKGVTVAKLREIHRLFSGGGSPQLHCTWLLGLAGDTRDSMRATISLANEIGTDDNPWFGFAVPYPGTEFYRSAADYGMIRTDVPYHRWTNEEPVFIPHGLVERDLREAMSLARSSVF